MKTIKILLVVVFMFAITFTHAQNIFAPTKVGTVQLYSQKNNRGKVGGYMRYTVNNVEGVGNMTISCTMEVLDKKQKLQTDIPFSKMPYKVIIKDGITMLDFKFHFHTPDMDMKGAVNDTMMFELPGNLQPGQSLKDITATVNMNATMDKEADIMSVTAQLTTKMTDGKCLAIETVTVPAGTFQCYKITQTVNTGKLTVHSPEMDAMMNDPEMKAAMAASDSVMNSPEMKAKLGNMGTIMDKQMPMYGVDDAAKQFMQSFLGDAKDDGNINRSNNKYTQTLISWYAPNVGLVKSETYNYKNKLDSSSELVEMK